jgi:hypothetical protein
MTQPGLIAEWRYSTAYMALSVLGGLFVASLPLGLVLLDANKGPAWLIPILAMFLGGTAVGGMLNVLTLRVRLLGDRIEKTTLLGTRSLPRLNILGRRRRSDGDFLIVLPEGRGRALLLPQRVMRVAAILTWLESLDDLDAKDLRQEVTELEVDHRLGSTVSARRETLVWLRRIATILSVTGVLIALWAIFLPRPFAVVAILCVGGPVVAILFALMRPDAVRLLSSNGETHAAGVVGMWMMPAIATSVLGMGYSLIDWRTSMIVAIAPASLFVAGSLLADRRLRHPLLAVFAAVIGYAWGWGGLVVANAQFDRAPPNLVAAKVISASAPDDRRLTITVASPALTQPVEDIDVSSNELKTLTVGARTCLLLFPGRFGWRYAFLALCPAISAKESTVLVLPPAGSRYRHARPPRPTAETHGR